MKSLIMTLMLGVVVATTGAVSGSASDPVGDLFEQPAFNSNIDG